MWNAFEASYIYAWDSTKTAYPSDEALRKVIYLATDDAAKKWTMPLRNWTDCISQLMITSGTDWMNNAFTTRPDVVFMLP